MTTVIFDEIDPWPDKVNFIDSNNRVLGYDMSSQCCESFGWTISTEPGAVGAANVVKGNKIDGRVFDAEYFGRGGCEDGEGEWVSFKLVSVHRDSAPPLFVTLWNCHNGYYSHGFVFRDSSEIQEGRI